MEYSYYKFHLPKTHQTDNNIPDYPDYNHKEITGNFSAQYPKPKTITLEKPQLQV